MPADPLLARFTEADRLREAGASKQAVDGVLNGGTVSWSSATSPTRCLHCRPRAYSPPPTHGARFGALFSARYPGVCSLCYGRIDEHDEITAVLDENDDTDGYACPWCIDGEEPNPCAVPQGRREELTGRLLALLTDTP
jgi:hypothetical protein